jgi:thiol-disulfide isomerase/thioredoxin
MSARRAVVAVALLISLTAAVALFIGQASDLDPEGESVDTGRRNIGFTLPALRAGEPDVVLAATPDRPTVVNFFAWSCEPCKRELPALRDAAAAHPDVAFLGVNFQASREDGIELLDAHGVTYPAGDDPRGDVGAKYAIRGLPATVFIDTAGRITAVKHGELTPAELQRQLDRLTLRESAA